MNAREEQAHKQEFDHDPKLEKLVDQSPELAVAVAKYLLLTRKLSRWRARQASKNGKFHYLSSFLSFSKLIKFSIYSINVVATIFGYDLAQRLFQLVDSAGD